jgi:type IV pilus assembly protein PilW
MPYRQRGLTLVELMVALVMGLIILAGVLTVFIANKQTYRFQDALSRLQENGRFAINMLERDIRIAGGTAECQLAIPPQNTLNQPDGSPPAGGVCPYRSWTPFGGEAIEGFDNVKTSAGGSGETYSQTFKIVGGSTIAPLPDTDVVQVLLSTTGGAKILQHQPKSAQFKTETQAGIADGDIVLVIYPNCRDGVVVQVTNTNDDKSNHHTEVVHNKGNRTDPGNDCNQLEESFVNGNLYRIQYRTYFVANTARGIPALYRFSMPGTVAEELVEGVEDLQVLYGVDEDNDSNRTVDSYRTAAWVRSNNLWGQVRSVRLHLLLQSADPRVLPQENLIDFTGLFSDHHPWKTVPKNDGRWRQTYGTTVAIRNRVL